VKTRSEKIDRIRKTILELLLSHAPDAFDLQDLAQEYGADRDRFEKDPSFCIHCGLCVRYCAEVKKKNAVGFVDRGIRKEIASCPRSRPRNAGTARSASRCAPPKRCKQPMC
jgi:bidirectional [NiFe] hydrogenase diaphorase subunit